MPSALRFRNRTARQRTEENASAGSGNPPATWSVFVDYDDDGFDSADAVTGKVLSRPGVRTFRGVDTRQALFRARGGTLSMNLLNDEGDFDEGTLLRRNKPVRVRSTFQGSARNLWTGYISDLDRQPSTQRQWVRCEGLDAIARLVGSGHSTQLYTDITVDVAINHVLDAAGWPASDRSITPSTRVLNHWWLDSHSDVLSELMRLVRTDGPAARLYSNVNGAIVFRPHSERSSATRSTTVQATFSGSVTAPVITDIRYSDGVDNIFNRVTLTHRTRADEPGDTPPFVWKGEDWESGASVADASVTFPDAVQKDDVALAVLTFTEEPDDSGAITIPDGWTEFTGSPVQTGIVDTHYYWKRLDDADPEEAQTWSWSSGGMKMVLAIGVWRGCITSGNPFDDDFNIESFTNDASPSVTEITTDGSNRRVVALMGSNEGQTGWTVPSGMTERVDRIADASTPTCVGTIADLEQAAQGASGAQEFTDGDAATESNILLVALIPPGSEVWHAAGDIVLANDETITLTARANGPFTGAIAPIEDNDFTLSAGSLASGPTLNRTSGQSVEITMTAGATGATVQGPPGHEARGMRLRAQLLSVSAEIEVTANDTGSQAEYGTRGVPGDYRIWHEIDLSDMQDLATLVVEEYKDPKQEATTSVAGSVAATLNALLPREISDRVALSITSFDIAFEAYVEGIGAHVGDAGHLVMDLAVREV